MIQDFVNAGPECYKKIVFCALSLGNQGQICEHDLFNMLESFKQRESFYFYKELITMPDVPRDFQHIIDFSDKIFFDAFANDIKMIVQSLNLRKFM